MIVRKLAEEDLLIRVEWMNHPKVYESMHFEIPILLEKTKIWFENNKSKGIRTDLVFEENGLVVAMGGLTNINKDVSKAELYVFVCPTLQKSGVGTSATKLLCQYGFEKLSLNKIYLETNEDNLAARRVYEKCGFKVEGVHRGEYKTKEGIYKDRIYYGLFREELRM